MDNPDFIGFETILRTITGHMTTLCPDSPCLILGTTLRVLQKTQMVSLFSPQS